MFDSLFELLVCACIFLLLVHNSFGPNGQKALHKQATCRPSAILEELCSTFSLVSVFSRKIVHLGSKPECEPSETTPSCAFENYIVYTQ